MPKSVTAWKLAIEVVGLAGYIQAINNLSDVDTEKLEVCGRSVALAQQKIRQLSALALTDPNITDELRNSMTGMLDGFDVSRI